jgi:hypothetical protein
MTKEEKMKNTFKFVNGEIYIDECKLKSIGDIIKFENNYKEVYCGKIVKKIETSNIEEGSLIKLYIKKDNKWFPIEKKLYTASTNILFDDLKDNFKEFKKELKEMIN